VLLLEVLNVLQEDVGAGEVGSSFASSWLLLSLANWRLSNTPAPRGKRPNRC
jgi:hypothetical protein